MVGFMERKIINHWMLDAQIAYKPDCYVCFSVSFCWSFETAWYHGGNSIGANGVNLPLWNMTLTYLKSLQVLCSDGCRFPMRFSLQVYSALFFILKDEPDGPMGKILVLAEALCGCCACLGGMHIGRYLCSPTASTPPSIWSELLQRPIIDYSNPQIDWTLVAWKSCRKHDWTMILCDALKAAI